MNIHVNHFGYVTKRTSSFSWQTEHIPYTTWD